MALKIYSLFADAASLRRFSFPLLHQFLLPYRDYLCEKYDFRWADQAERFPFEHLAGILGAPRPQMPDMLRNGLFFINALSAPKEMAKVAEALQYQGQLPPRPLPLRDSTLYAWLADPGILQWVHTHFITEKNNIIELFFSNGSSYPDDSKERLSAWEDELNGWGETFKKNFGVQVMAYHRNHTVEFHLRYGELERKENVARSKSTTSRAVHRPQRIDILLCIPHEKRLEIRSKVPLDTRLHCFLFGKHCFGNPNYYPLQDAARYYTLAPLRERGRESLICRDINGMERVCLWEVQAENSKRNSVEVFRAKKNCIFDEHKTLDSVVDMQLNLIQASFLVYLSDANKPVLLRIDIPNHLFFPIGLGYDRIETWAKRRTFARF